MNWNELLGTVVQAILVAVLPILAVFAVKWAQVKIAQIKDVISPDFRWILDQAAELGVYAAEQLKKSGQIEEKKAYAVDIANKFMIDNHLPDVHVDLIVAAVEKAVLQANFDEKSRPSGYTLPDCE